MKITPLFDRVFVRPIEASNRTTGGLYIPDIAIGGTPYQLGEIVAVGDGRYTDQGVLVHPRVKPGDVVMWWRTSEGGNQILVPDPDNPGSEMWMIREMYCVGLCSELTPHAPIVDAGGNRVVM